MHGNGYGTPRAPVEKVLAQGRDMLFDIDWQGAKQVRERLGDDVVIDLRPAAVDDASCAPGSSGGPRIPPPPSRQRLEAARHEIERWRNYHYVIVNDDLQRAYRDVLAIVTAERLKVRRVAGRRRAVRRASRPRLTRRRRRKQPAHRNLC